MTSITRPVPYQDEQTQLIGVLAWDDAQSDRRPGILLVHGGGGLDEHAKEQAERYAALGYVVLAADMYGPEVAGDRERVMTCLRTFRDDPQRLSQRAAAGLTALSRCPQVDGRAAAIGFCFGGMAVLSLARAGVQLAGVVSIHGSLATIRRAEPGGVAARVLVCHGASDPHVPLADVSRFAEEMTEAGADWQLIMYGGALHGFTHRHAIPGATTGVAYDGTADRRSFAAVKTFLDELVDRAGSAG
jgi:dienelactone hydrolase